MKELTDRMRKIGKEGLELFEESKKKTHGGFVIHWNDWYSRSIKLLESAFGVDSELYASFKDSRVRPQLLAKIKRGDEFRQIVGTYLGSQFGMIMAAVSMLEDDWLTAVQETATRKAVSSLERTAFDLLSDGHKDASAILGRVILEKKLHDICKKLQVKLRKKKPGINDYTNELYTKKKLKKHEMRAVQRWTDIGNDAIHLRFDQYSKKDVQEMLAWIGDFEG